MALGIGLILTGRPGRRIAYQRSYMKGRNVAGEQHAEPPPTSALSCTKALTGIADTPKIRS
jgi:hypothetical protein